jgi:hypothetical protein
MHHGRCSLSVVNVCDAVFCALNVPSEPLEHEVFDYAALVGEFEMELVCVCVCVCVCESVICPARLTSEIETRCRLFTHVHTYIYTNIHTYMHTYIHTHMHIQTDAIVGAGQRVNVTLPSSIYVHDVNLLDVDVGDIEEERVFFSHHTTDGTFTHWPLLGSFILQSPHHYAHTERQRIARDFEVYMYMYMYICIYIYVCVCVCVSVYMCARLSLHSTILSHTYSYTYNKHTHTHTYIHIYIHTYIHYDYYEHIQKYDFDRLAERTSRLSEILKNGAPTRERPLCVYVHCVAGIDRTGEMIGAYLLRTTRMSLSQVLSYDDAIGHRPIAKASRIHLEWFCLWLVATEQVSPHVCTD